MTERKYSEIYDYLSAPELPSEATGSIVFGRKDPLVAHKYVDLSEQGLVKWGVITGGIGKDSGDLQVPEAEYLAQEAEKYAALTDAELPPTFLEIQATNGGENARNSLDVIRRGKLGHNVLLAVAHGTSLRRLAHMLDHAATKRNETIDTIYRAPSEYDFNASNPADQEEALAEMKRLMDWPEKDWLLPKANAELPEDLVDFVQDKIK
jgi:hypothetical protein